LDTRQFGKTSLRVSEIGFGAWGIGGPTMAGNVPIGWGDVDDSTSLAALKRAFDLGITFYDTADFYGLGHSEELIGKSFGNSKDVVIATKVGHRLSDDRSIYLDYSKEYILTACENSLKRLRRDCIDYYQLHSAKKVHLEQGECIEAMERLKSSGKIRYWGLSLNTFHPDPEADFMIEHGIGDGLQLVLNIINQRSLRVITRAKESGYGIIARMPLQFGLLTGKFTKTSKFSSNDHRKFRLSPEILNAALLALENLWPIAERKGISKSSLSLSYCASIAGISTIIPGIKTPAQAEENTKDIITLGDHDLQFIAALYRERLAQVTDMMEKQG
jgi:aryl-alcohol dehydrogenase-like predicted oxidoreductase